MKEKFVIIESSFPDLKSAKNLSAILLKNFLAACIQIKKIESLYIWQAKIANKKEFLISIKTKSEKFNKIAQIIKKNHPYDLPEIISLPITQGDKKYLSWIETNISQKPK